MGSGSVPGSTTRGSMPSSSPGSEPTPTASVTWSAAVAEGMRRPKVRLAGGWPNSRRTLALFSAAWTGALIISFIVCVIINVDGAVRRGSSRHVRT